MQIGEQTIGAVGLTGNIAAGKSTVGDIFRQLGVRVIDADQLARQVVEPGSRGLEQIVQTFGDEVLTDRGELDRDKLGSIVFGDSEARRRLESITHPLIARKMRRRAEQAARQGESWFVYEAALLVENNAHEWLDKLIVVTTDPETRRDRLVSRDDLSKHEADERIESQLPESRKIAVADYTIDNNGSLDETRRQTRQIFEKLDNVFETHTDPGA